MTDEERFLFDLNGYLLIKNAVPADQVIEMNAYIDAQQDADMAWRPQRGNAHVENPIKWGQQFLDLMTLPSTYEVIDEICGPSVRLDHDYAIFLEPGHTGLVLHGKLTIPFDPIHYYYCFNNQIRCGLTVATFALSDVPEGSGGLCVVPGSHKSNFQAPRDVRFMQRKADWVKHIPMKAGDCCIFTEALLHGTLPWDGPGERRTLFYKYAPHGIAWEKSTYFPSDSISGLDELIPTLTNKQRALLSPPAAFDFYPKDHE